MLPFLSRVDRLCRGWTGREAVNRERTIASMSGCLERNQKDLGPLRAVAWEVRKYWTTCEACKDQDMYKKSQEIDSFFASLFAGAPCRQTVFNCTQDQDREANIKGSMETETNHRKPGGACRSMPGIRHSVRTSSPWHLAHAKKPKIRPSWSLLSHTGPMSKLESAVTRCVSSLNALSFRMVSLEASLAEK